MGSARTGAELPIPKVEQSCVEAPENDGEGPRGLAPPKCADDIDPRVRHAGRARESGAQDWMPGKPTRLEGNPKPCAYFYFSPKTLSIRGSRSRCPRWAAGPATQLAVSATNRRVQRGCVRTREKQQVPPLRYAPVGMTILLQGNSLQIGGGMAVNGAKELSSRPERSAVEGPAVSLSVLTTVLSWG